MRHILIIIFTILIHNCLAQKEVPKNLPKYDMKTLRFGYTLGFTTMDFGIRPSESFLNTDLMDTVYSIENKRQPGFHLGIISELHIVNYLDLRFLPGLSFGERDLTYLLYNEKTSSFYTHTMRIESTFLDFPLLVKYSSERVNNYRMYIIGGASYKYDLASQKDILPEEKPKIRLKRSDAYYELGFGIDYFFMYFKFSTEIKFGGGLTNVLIPDDTQFTTSIDRLSSKMIVLSLHFEGGKYDGAAKMWSKIISRYK